MANPIKALHHWIKVQQFQLWLSYHGACEPGKAPYKGMTAEEAYWASRADDLYWALLRSDFNNLNKLMVKSNSYLPNCLEKLKLALGFPTKAKDAQFVTYEARRKFIADNKLG